MSYRVARIHNQRWGIFYKSRLLATIATRPEAKRLMDLLNRRALSFEPEIEAESSDLEPDRTQRSKAQDTAQNDRLKAARISKKVA